MLFVMDVGNSHTVLGLYDGDRLTAHWRIWTQNYRTADELRVMLGVLLAQEDADVEAITGCCISSVVPQLNLALTRVTQLVFGLDALMVEPGIKTGLVIQYDNPREVGADRIVNAVAAIEEYGGPLILIDFGTATTFDAITAQAEYLGGIIVPGIEVSTDALFEKCAKLPRVEVSTPSCVIGRNTVDSIRSGLTYGYADLVDGIVDRVAREMDGDPKTVATGGMARIMAGITKRIGAVDPLLTLKGLKAIYRRNERGSA